MKVVVTCVSLALALVLPGGASIAAEETPGQSLRIIVPPLGAIANALNNEPSMSTVLDSAEAARHPFAGGVEA